jgi:GDP-L-fucose synthase
LNPDDFLSSSRYFIENIQMNTNILKWSRLTGVKRFIGVLSTCIYPDVVDEYPMTENMLHKGPPTPTNFSYGYAKRCLSVHIDACNKQYDTNYQYLIPCNLYGENDKFGENSHFIAALVKKIFDAKQNNEKSITLFGDGSPLRQFMFADDFAKIIHHVIDNEIYDSFNVAGNENLSIKEMANIVLNSCDAEHLDIIWDLSKPNGQHRKDVSIEKMLRIFPNFSKIIIKTSTSSFFSSMSDILLFPKFKLR